MRLAVPQDQDLIAALNSVYLPPLFAGIWHTDTKDLEFIWKPLSKDRELDGRRFEVYYDNSVVTCEWAAPSKTLIYLSLCAQPVDTILSQTNYRNLLDLQRGMLYRSKNRGALPRAIGSPSSFWMRDVEWDASNLQQLCQHINFYMRYYDNESPVVTVIEDIPETPEVTVPRYPDGKFPQKITAFALNPHMLDLWTITIFTSDPLRKFLHAYQIIEYFAHYHVNNKAMEDIRKLILKPNALSNVDYVTSSIIDVMTPVNQDDRAKLEAMLKECVDPNAVWQAIQPFRAAFSRSIEFDGGFSQEALISENEKEVDFAKNWPNKFVAKLEALRNNILHAREKRHSTRIAPTLATQKRLIPWAAVTLRVAEEIMIYQK